MSSGRVAPVSAAHRVIHDKLGLGTVVKIEIDHLILDFHAADGTYSRVRNADPSCPRSNCAARSSSRNAVATQTMFVDGLALTVTMH